MYIDTFMFVLSSMNVFKSDLYHWFFSLWIFRIRLDVRAMQRVFELKVKKNTCICPSEKYHNSRVLYEELGMMEQTMLLRQRKPNIHAQIELWVMSSNLT